MAYHVLLPLVQGTLQNVKNFDAGKALTGPIVRGDTESIKEHLEALDKQPELRDIYIKIAHQSLQIVKREKKLSKEKFKALEALLGGK